MAASTKITRTPGSASDTKTWTYSMWFKLGNIGTEYVLFHTYGASTSTETFVKIGDATNPLDFGIRDGGSYVGRLITNRVFKDPGAWYHIVFVCDTTDSTPGDRMQIWVNGVRETSFSTDTNPGLDQVTVINNTYLQTIGSYGTGNYFDGEMSHVQLVDGAALAPTEFGEFDSTSGIWKIKTACYATPGTNGFCLKMEDSSNMDLDSSSNALTFVTTGTLTATKDNPSNSFAVWNPVDNYWANMDFFNGNTTTGYNGSDSRLTWISATLGASKGKFYWEVKPIYKTGGAEYMIGITSDVSRNSTSTSLGELANDVGYYATNGNIRANDTYTSFGDSYDVDDIIGVALDLDNNKLYYSKDGVWQNSGDPTSGATGTGAVSITAATSTGAGLYFPAWAFYSGSANGQVNANFGNGYFASGVDGGTYSAIASAGTNASNLGIFEYDVPTGYTALCTRGLNL